MKTFVSLVALSFPLFLFAGDPIPGIDITVNQSPGGKVATATTDDGGQVIFSGLQPGRYTLDLAFAGRTVEVGTVPGEQIIVRGNQPEAVSIKPIRLELATRAAPGKERAATAHELTHTVQQRKTKALDGHADSPADDVRGASNNSSAMAEQLKPADCREFVEVLPMSEGKMRVRLFCE